MPATLIISVLLCFCLGFPLQLHAQTEIVFHIVEECRKNTLVGNVRQKLAASGRYLDQDLRTFSYKLLSAGELVRLDSESGAIFTNKRIDRESLCEEMNHCCSEDEDDNGACRIKSQVALLVGIKPTIKELLLVEFVVDDINDNAPSWRSNSIELDIPEHTLVNSKFKLPTATDPDRGPDNTTAQYGIVSQSSPGMFSLHADAISTAPHRRRQFDLRLKVNRELDREEADFHRVTMFAVDDGRPPRTGTVIINITVTDINDQRPIFRTPNPQTSVREDKSVHTMVYNMSARDRDLSDHQRLRYRLGSSASESVMRAFNIDASRGLVYVNGELDYERHRQYVIPITVTDGKHVTETTLTVNVINVNDNPPTITIHSMSGGDQISIKENQPRDTTIATVSVVDKDDKKQKDAIDCFITGSDDFALRPLYIGALNMHRIVTKVQFDRERQQYSNAVIECTDRKEPRQLTRKPFRVNIEDQNDSPPIFQNVPMTTNLREDSPINTKIIRVVAKDADTEENARIWYPSSRPHFTRIAQVQELQPLADFLEQAFRSESIQGADRYDHLVVKYTYSLDAQSQQRFTIDRNSGVIRTKVLFDRETVKSVNITVIAQDRITPRDRGIPKETSYQYGRRVNGRPSSRGGLNSDYVVNTVSATVQVFIDDANDCPPIFESGNYKLDVLENSKVNTKVGQLIAKDRDVTSPNNRITYSMLHERKNIAHQYFKVKSNGMVLTKRSDVDREETPVLTFTALAKDGGKPAQTSSVTVIVQVHDENDHAPKWQFPTKQQRSVNITYDTPLGHKVAQLIATDLDEGPRGEVVYSLRRGNERQLFQLDSSTGNLYLSRSLGKSDIRMYQLMVQASDKGNRPRSALSILEVHVLTQQQRKPPRSRRTDNNQMIILISIVTVTLIISLFLIAAIVFLRCGRCRKLTWPSHHRSPGVPNGRATYYPDGNSSPGVMDMPTLTKTKMHTIDRLRPLYSENKFHGEDADSLDSGRGCSSDTGGAARSDSTLVHKMQSGPLSDSPNMNPYSIDGKRPTQKLTSFRTPQLDGSRTTMRGRFSVTWDPTSENSATLPQSSYQHIGGTIDEPNYSNVPEEETNLGLRRDDYNDVRAYTPLTHARLSSPNLYTRQPTSFV